MDGDFGGVGYGAGNRQRAGRNVDLYRGCGDAKVDASLAVHVQIIDGGGERRDRFVDTRHEQTCTVQRLVDAGRGESKAENSQISGINMYPRRAQDDVGRRYHDHNGRSSDGLAIDRSKDEYARVAASLG